MFKYLIGIVSTLVCLQSIAMEGKDGLRHRFTKGTAGVFQFDGQAQQAELNAVLVGDQEVHSVQVSDEEAMDEIVPGSFAQLPDEIVKLIIFGFCRDERDMKSVARTCSKYWGFVDEAMGCRPAANAFFTTWSKKSKAELVAFDPLSVDGDTVTACHAFYPLWVKSWKVDGAGSAEGHFHTQGEENVKKHYVACRLLGDAAAQSKLALENSVNCERFAGCYCAPSCCNAIGTIVGGIAGTAAAVAVGGIMVTANKDVIGVVGSASASGYVVFKLVRGYFRFASLFSEDALTCDDVSDLLSVINDELVDVEIGDR